MAIEHITPQQAAPPVAARHAQLNNSPNARPAHNAARAAEESSASETNPDNLRPEERVAELGKAVEQMNQFVQSTASDIVFTVDKDSGTLVVKVVDRASKELIRQIPSEEALHIAKVLDKFQGLLLRDKA